jgi:hypothetical protein
MSLYQTQKLLFNLANDEEVRRRYYDEDRDAVLAQYELSPNEQRAFRDSDVGELYAMGVNPLLLIAFGSRAGLPWSKYIEALRQAEPRRREAG